jgi:Type IV secretion system pilin
MTVFFNFSKIFLERNLTKFKLSFLADVFFISKYISLFFILLISFFGLFGSVDTKAQESIVDKFIPILGQAGTRTPATTTQPEEETENVEGVGRTNKTNQDTGGNTGTGRQTINGATGTNNVVGGDGKTSGVAGTGATATGGKTGGGSTTLEELNILENVCIFDGGPGCEGKTSIITQLIDFAKLLSNSLAVLVILWGGYKYYFSALISGAEDGKKAIYAGVIGLVVINLADFIAGIVAGENGVVQEGGFNEEPIANFIGNIQNNLAIPLATVFAVLVIIYGGYQFMFSSIPEVKGDGLETIKKGVIGLVVILIAIPIINLVQGVLKVSKGGSLQLNSNPIVEFIQVFLLNILIPVSTVISLFFVVLGGYNMITSNGDSGKFEEGVKSLKNALIGLIVVLLATTIVQLIVLFVPVTV